ncbi:effector-associated constant component EACC1 [Nonomuraea insulae]|uniref:Uncharacterized protein n=1 Tax=Nonomuraea insulae TaxID=1616787 RepID=A0ABW1DBG2_9ACTN
MRVTVRVRSMGKSGTLISDLARYLNGQEKLRGRVRLTGAARPAPGMSQPVSAIVLELLGSTGVVFAAATITWLRHRTADTKITVRRADGMEFELSAQRVRRLGPKELSALAEQIAELAGEPGPSRPAEGAARQDDAPAANDPEAAEITSDQVGGAPELLAELRQVDNA